MHMCFVTKFASLIVFIWLMSLIIQGSECADAWKCTNDACTNITDVVTVFRYQGVHAVNICSISWTRGRWYKLKNVRGENITRSCPKGHSTSMTTYFTTTVNQSHQSPNDSKCITAGFNVTLKEKNRDWPGNQNIGELIRRDCGNYFVYSWEFNCTYLPANQTPVFCLENVQEINTSTWSTTGSTVSSTSPTPQTTSTTPHTTTTPQTTTTPHSTILTPYSVNISTNEYITTKYSSNFQHSGKGSNLAWIWIIFVIFLFIISVSWFNFQLVYVIDSVVRGKGRDTHMSETNQNHTGNTTDQTDDSTGQSDEAAEQIGETMDKFGEGNRNIILEVPPGSVTQREFTFLM